MQDRDVHVTPTADQARRGGVRDRDRLRRTGAVAAVLLAVLAVVVPVGLFAAHRDTTPPRPADTPAPSVLGTAAALAAGHWEDLPPAPIQARRAAAYTWTGSQLLVWGGQAVTYDGLGERLADGASYDPATKTWTVLPAGPLGTLENLASAWTGSQWLVLGRPSGGRTVSQQMASYDPATRTWTELTLPEGRTLLYAPTASWTGRELVVVGFGSGAITASRQTTGREVSAYDPATATWRTLADLPEPDGQGTRGREAGVTDGDVVVLSEWDSRADVVTSAGVSAWRLDLDEGTWTAVGGTDPEGLSEPVTTPDGLLLPGAPGVCPANASCARVGGESGRQLDDAGWTPLPDSPVIAGHGVWTGSALMVADAEVRGEIPSHLTYGSAAAYDPTNRTWTSLPPARSVGTDDGVVVWTGQELIVWGSRVCGAAALCVPDPPRETGRVLVPAPPASNPTVTAPAGPVEGAVGIDSWVEEHSGDLILSWLGGRCGPGSNGADARVEESDAEVRVVVVPRPPRSKDESCFALGVPMTSWVTLAAPVGGDRRVVNVGVVPAQDVPPGQQILAEQTESAIAQARDACLGAAATLRLTLSDNNVLANSPEGALTVDVVRGVLPGLPAEWADLPGDSPVAQCLLVTADDAEPPQAVAAVVTDGLPPYVYERDPRIAAAFRYLGEPPN